MKKIGIFYGSTTGQTAEVARKIADKLGVESSDVKDVAKYGPSDVGDYDLIVLGASTWGAGDMQEDMHDFLDGVRSLALNGKKFALFGCGDDTMRHTFCNAIGEMFEMVKDTGAEIIGAFNGLGYDYEETAAQVDSRIVGLMIDNVNHSDLTDERIEKWTDELKKAL